jgi:23S rRNA (adenine2503-C2)-methyltransferase
LAIERSFFYGSVFERAGEFMMAPSLPLALDMNQSRWKAWAEAHGAKSFVAQQIENWIYVRGVRNPMQFSDLTPSLRTALEQEFQWDLPLEVDTILPSTDGSEKILWKTSEGFFSESVLMPTEGRVTLCVSSQVGCKMACTFCQTGKMGFTKNLSQGEIVGQLLLANERLKIRGDDRKVTNVVFMGMGEPLDNLENVVDACKIMISPKLLGLSKHKVTVSTSGLLPEIEKLGQSLPVALAISLHSADDAQRSEMMPVNRRYPLAALKDVLLKYPIQTRHGITFEYVMIQDKNDSIQHAKKLVKFVSGLKAKVNLIPMNPHPGTPMEASTQERLYAFQQYLTDRSIPAPIRFSKGQDVSAACGQLAAKRRDELEQKPRTVALARRREFLENNSRPR